MIIDKTMTEPVLSFRGIEGEGGFATVTYHVPTDFPQGQTLEASLEIEIPD